MRRCLPLVLLVLTPATAPADVVLLDNGLRLQGIITEETKQDVTVEVALDAFTTVEKASVVKAERESSAANKKLLAGWKEDERQAQEKEAAEKKFAADQRAKGLVLFDGEWMTAQEAKLLLAERGADSPGQYVSQYDASVVTQQSDGLISFGGFPRGQRCLSGGCSGAGPSRVFSPTRVTGGPPLQLLPPPFSSFGMPRSSGGRAMSSSRRRE